MIRLRACPRCRGDMVVEDLGHGEIDLVCLQCSHRIEASPEESYSVRLAKSRRRLVTRPAARVAA